MATVPELANFRAKYPGYDDLDDSTLAQKLAAKYPDAYGDLPAKVQPQSAVAPNSLAADPMNMTGAEKAKWARERENFVNNTGTAGTRIKHKFTDPNQEYVWDAPVPALTKSIGNTLNTIVSAPRDVYGKLQTALDPNSADNLRGQDQNFGQAMSTLGSAAVDTVQDLGAPVGLRGLEGVKESWGKNPVQSALLAAPVGKVLSGAAKEGVALTKTMRTPKPEVLDGLIDQTYTQAVRPTVAGKTNSTLMDSAKNQRVEAVKTIVDNKDAIPLDTKTGLPTNLEEFSRAIKNTKDEIFSQYDALKSSAGENSASVDLNPIAAELEKLAGNKVLSDTKPEVVNYIRNKAQSLRKRGEYSVADAQEAIRIYNSDLEAFYKNPSYDMASRVAVDARVVSAMREGLDRAIESDAGPGYQQLKNQYGALKSIEKEVAQRAVVDARKNPKGLLDFTDIATSGEALYGLLTANPAAFIKGVAGRGIKEWIKNRNNPNKMVERMFNTLDKKHTSRPGVDIPEQMMPPEIPTTYDPSTGRNIAVDQYGGIGRGLNLRDAVNPNVSRTYDPSTGRNMQMGSLQDLGVRNPTARGMYYDESTGRMMSTDIKHWPGRK